MWLKIHEVSNLKCKYHLPPGPITWTSWTEGVGEGDHLVRRGGWTSDRIFRRNNLLRITTNIKRINKTGASPDTNVTKKAGPSSVTETWNEAWVLNLVFSLGKTSGPGSAVGIATGYGLGGPGIESRWGARFSAPVQTGPGAHPASCTMGTVSFPGVKSGRGVTLTPHPLLLPWSWKSRAIPPLPLRAVRPVQSLSACTRVHFTLLYLGQTKDLSTGCSFREVSILVEVTSADKRKTKKRALVLIRFAIICNKDVLTPINDVSFSLRAFSLQFWLGDKGPVFFTLCGVASHLHAFLPCN